MPKITNKRYRQFLDTQIIAPITQAHILRAFKNMGKEKNVRQARCLLITLYLTGARPAEVLKLHARDFSIDQTYLSISLPTLKRGRPRILFFERTNILVQYLEKYVGRIPPDAVVFFNFISKSKRIVRQKQKDGTYKMVEYAETSMIVRQRVTKWFEGVIDGGMTPYFLRHNRLSKLAAEGVDSYKLKYWKGARNLSSVEPYVHINIEQAKSIGKKVE